ncbi:substrate binding protein [Alloactinosynnema sp. L-07]|uniref:ABC transporter substrate-binding protein n=1 Tax=Alloactinosynnema sp. L-07 TaxID=1653480 RepID=UPI00065F093E|nr:ABC transporter substrate-binding protein [Alloactinosynnema sp. L-07]CRK58838.1 substrate binding protein [Alloactinosynnema sp. L-07]
MVLSRAVAVALVGLLAACTAEPTPTASGDREGRSMVIATAVAPASLDPLSGYAPYGAAKIYDGLVELEPGGTLRPVLAAALPVPSADGKAWTIVLRDDVFFHDKAKFGAADVIATYQAVLAGALKSRFSTLAAVHQLDSATVRFDLTLPTPGFASLLVLGIKRAGDAPVGTGPYQVESWKPGRSLVLKAYPDHRGGAPKITRVTVEFVPDDEIRAQRLRDGKLDGADLPARLAVSFQGSSAFTTVRHSAADVRVVTLPSISPVTGDASMRLALNLCVDRRKLVDTALAGRGKPTSLPVPTALAEFVEPGARFEFDVPRAKAVLDMAGWVPGLDGVRRKSGVVAEFDVAYPVADIANRELVAGFAAAAAAIGVKVTPRPTLRAALTGATAELTAVGDPLDPGRALSWLGDRTAAAAAVTDPAQRAVAFRAVQRAYLDEPSAVVLAESDHSYVIRQNWNGYQPVVDATGTDHTWGAWWNLQTWAPR